MLPERISARNWVALDRGYLNLPVIVFLVKCGLVVIGTHKRMRWYPFTFGEGLTEAQRRGRQFIKEVGLKSIYWAQCKTRECGTRLFALAYRMGCGRVATLITSNPDVQLGRYFFNVDFHKMVLMSPHCSDLSTSKRLGPFPVPVEMTTLANTCCSTSLNSHPGRGALIGT